MPVQTKFHASVEIRFRADTGSSQHPTMMSALRSLYSGREAKLKYKVVVSEVGYSDSAGQIGAGDPIVCAEYDNVASIQEAIQEFVTKVLGADDSALTK
ncbi:MAG: hypothetical protein ACHQWH_02760 [Nitrososphaerales archaeon]|jgi:PDZ domain-containing secreted protein